MLFMKSLGTKAAFFVASLFAGTFLIKRFGSFYINDAVGFRRGNRMRIISILKLEWLMLHIDLIIYLHLFSFFTAPYIILKFGEDRKPKAAINYIKKLRFRLFIVYLVGIFFAHLLYALYIFERIRIPWLIYDISGIFNGIWLHLAAFSCFFVGLNFVLDQALARIEIIRWFIQDKLFCWCPSLRLLLRVPQFQVLTTLVISFMLCLTHWYFSDKIVTHQLSIPLTSYNSSVSGTLRAVILTDLHAGASVYREQIERVVNEVNAIESVDAVFIIGDAIDAPAFLIEDRMRALKFLNSRLGTFFVTGNHEYYYGNVDEWIKLFRSYGITTLRNQAISLNGVCIVGLDDISSKWSGIFAHSMDVSAISKCPLNEPIVVLEHNPAATKQIIGYAGNINRHVDLIVSGHTHASQYYVMAPYIYWLLPYFYGIYHVDAPTVLRKGDTIDAKTMLLVSAGTLYQGGPMKMPFMSQVWLLNLSY